MEKTRKRALELAHTLGLTEEFSSNVIVEAREELKELFGKLDGETQKEVMERIRGYS